MSRHHIDKRGFARAVGPQKTQDFTAVEGQVHTVARFDASKVLAQTLDLKRHWHLTPVQWLTRHPSQSLAILQAMRCLQWLVGGGGASGLQ